MHYKVAKKSLLAACFDIGSPINEPLLYLFHSDSKALDRHPFMCGLWMLR